MGSFSSLKSDFANLATLSVWRESENNPIRVVGVIVIPIAVAVDVIEVVHAVRGAQRPRTVHNPYKN